jgi:hypothetical protein
MMFLIVAVCSPEPLAAMVPATPRRDALSPRHWRGREDKPAGFGEDGIGLSGSRERAR